LRRKPAGVINESARMIFTLALHKIDLARFAGMLLLVAFTGMMLDAGCWLFRIAYIVKTKNIQRRDKTPFPGSRSSPLQDFPLRGGIFEGC
jgi:hypothetical protein